MNFESDIDSLKQSVEELVATLTAAKKSHPALNVKPAPVPSEPEPEDLSVGVQQLANKLDQMRKELAEKKTIPEETNVAETYYDEKLEYGSEKEKRGEGMRFSKDKPPLEFAPIHLLTGAAQVFKDVTERKINPYPKWNWAKGMPWSVPYACMLRHLGAWFCGEDLDTETGLNHLHHVHCNLLILTHYLEAYKEGDDRPTEYFKKGGMTDDTEK